MQFPICFVGRGKTSERYVWPLYPEWGDWIDLDVKIPENSKLTNSELGNIITKLFKRRNISFSPYNLRHAWAIRAMIFGLDISLAAAQMGHSVPVHSRIYHHWITRDVHQRAYDILVNRDDRPKPPT